MAITQNITLDDLLDMNMSDFEDTISSMTKTELNKIQIVLDDYSRTTSSRNILENKVALKLNYIKNAKSVKKSLKTVIAKVQEESKQESTQAPKNDKAQKPRNSSLSGVSIKSSSDTIKNTGTNYNYQRGQGDFFGKSSAFRFIKQMSENMQSDSSNDNQMGFDFGNKVKKTRNPSEKSNIGKLSITHLEPKALKQIKDILMLPEKIAKQSRVKRTPTRQTKAEKTKAELKRDELEFKKQHLAELKYKHRSDSRFDRKKFRETVKATDARTEAQKLTLQFREKVEANKLKRLELNTELKEKLAQKHIEFSKLAVEKLKIKRQADKDKQDGRLQLQKQRKDQTNRNQMERHLHAIHPALGLLYGMSKNKNEAQGGQNSNSGGGLSSLLGSLAGGVGVAGAGMMGKGFGAFKGVGKGVGSNSLKLAGSRIPILGAGIAGISEGIESGSVGKGLATFAGALSGSALVGAAAGAVFGPLGAIVGAIAGNAIGMIAAKDIFDALNSKNTVDTNSPRANALKKQQEQANTQPIKKTGFGRFASLNTPTNNQSASGKISRADMSGDDFVAKEEGLSLKAYLDGATKSGKDLVSIGRGHQIKDHEYAQGFIQAGQDRIPISGNKGLGTKLTKEQAEALYKSDMEVYSNTARNELGADIYDKLTEKQKTALTSYTYNTGSLKSLIKNGLRDKLQSGDISGASDIIRDKGIKTSKNKYNEGLDNRRKKEAAMFAEKAPPKVSSLQDSTNRIQQKQMEDKSKPMNVITVGGSNGGSSSVVNNTYVNPPNMDATIRQISGNAMYPARVN